MILCLAVVTPLKLVRCPLARSYPRHFTLITRTPRACASYPSCVAVYPRDSHSRRVLCRFPQALHSLTRDVFYVADPVSSIPANGSLTPRSLGPNLTREWEFFPITVQN